MPLRSFRLGLSGQADVVESAPVKHGETGVLLASKKGCWRPFPIEYKRTKDKVGSLAYRVQLCAQALCLEEMLLTTICEGAIYDGSAKRRHTVTFDGEIRSLIESTAAEMHRLFANAITPAPVLKKACQSCSLHDRCFPEILQQQPAVARYLRKFLAKVTD